MKDKNKKILFGLLTILIVLLICYFILELTIKFTGIAKLSKEEHPYRSNDAVLHHILRPGSTGIVNSREWNHEVSINSLGFYDEEISKQKPLGTIRILMLGDSFTEGIFVDKDKTIAGQLEYKLKGLQNGVSYDVINAGVSSYSPILEYLQLKEKDLALSPDIVVLNFDITDVQNDQEYSRYAVFSEGELVAVPNPDSSGTTVSSSVKSPILDFFRRHSYSYQFLAFNMQNIAWKKRVGDISIDYLAVARDSENNYDEAWTLTFNYILKIKKISEENGAKFILVIYPWPHQVSTEYWLTRNKYYIDKKLYSEEPFDKVRAFAKENNIELVDTVSVIKEVAAQKNAPKLYWDYDFHMTEAGLGIVADSIYEFISANLINNTVV